MPTATKNKIYIIPKNIVFSRLEALTGQASIAPFGEYVVEIDDPNATLGSRSWNIVAFGSVDPTRKFYEKQIYNVTDNELATFINNNAQTALSASNIVDFKIDKDATYYEIETN